VILCTPHSQERKKTYTKITAVKATARESRAILKCRSATLQQPAAAAVTVDEQRAAFPRHTLRAPGALQLAAP